jgi:hypothetical protein
MDLKVEEWVVDRCEVGSRKWWSILTPNGDEALFSVESAMRFARACQDNSNTGYYRARNKRTGDILPAAIL